MDENRDLLLQALQELEIECAECYGQREDLASRQHVADGRNVPTRAITR